MAGRPEGEASPEFSAWHQAGANGRFLISVGVSAVGFRVVFQSNHVGHGLWDYWPYWVAWVAAGLANLAPGGRNRYIAVWLLLLCLCLFIPLGIYLLDHFDLLVAYEEWIRRGMPEKPWL